MPLLRASSSDPALGFMQLRSGGELKNHGGEGGTVLQWGAHNVVLSNAP